MKHKPELGIKDPYQLNEDQYKATLGTAAPAAQARRPLLARRLHPDRRLQERGRRGFGSWPFQVNLLSRRRARRLGLSGRGCDRLGRHDDDACRRGKPELRLQVVRAPALLEPAVRPRGSGSAPIRRCRGRAPTGAACRPRKAARPTASTISRRCISGRRRRPNAPRRAMPCCSYYRWVSDYIGVIGGAVSVSLPLAGKPMRSVVVGVLDLVLIPTPLVSRAVRRPPGGPPTSGEGKARSSPVPDLP